MISFYYSNFINYIITSSSWSNYYLINFNTSFFDPIGYDGFYFISALILIFWSSSIETVIENTLRLP